MIRTPTSAPNSHGFRKAWKTKASRCALLVKRTPSACWGVYFEQNATTEKYEDFDGERWIVLND